MTEQMVQDPYSSSCPSNPRTSLETLELVEGWLEKNLTAPVTTLSSMRRGNGHGGNFMAGICAMEWII